MSRPVPAATDRPSLWMALSGDAELVADPAVCVAAFPAVRVGLARRLTEIQVAHPETGLAADALAAWAAILAAHQAPDLAIQAMVDGLTHDRPGLVRTSLSALPRDEQRWRLANEAAALTRGLDLASDRSAAAMVGAITPEAACRLACKAPFDDLATAFERLVRAIATPDALPGAGPGAHPGIRTLLARLETGHGWLSWRAETRRWFSVHQQGAA